MGKYIKELYYITHIDNLESILENGVLAHRIIEDKGIQYTPIYDAEIVSRRSKRQVTGQCTLWDFANLYFQARNPMLYRVVHEKGLEQIIVLGVRRDIMNTPDVVLTDGNAASSSSAIFRGPEIRKHITEITENTQDIEWWSEADGTKRKIMAECLVPQSISHSYIQTIYVANLDVRTEIYRRIGNANIQVVPQPDIFFQPTRKIELAANLKLVEGDMFFSKLQTLTISVNCVGVMGKGLASRAKYQFPRVYVHYEDLCKEKKLRMGRPVLYKQEQSRDLELADEPATMGNGLTETWFLLFPTKDDWRKKADIAGIRRGLEWLSANYRSEGIKSLAMPALGCGLGWLDWSTVGPLLCATLADLDIETWVYLPTEKRVPQDQLTSEFLLRK